MRVLKNLARTELNKTIEKFANFVRSHKVSEFFVIRIKHPTSFAGWLSFFAVPDRFPREIK